jgi:hypothetical protein
VGVHKRKYYHFDGNLASPSSSSLVLVKWVEGDTVNVSTPMKNLGEAMVKCQSYLEKGICSWMVSYNG